MNIEELKKLLKENKIHFYTYWSKQKLIELANTNNLLPKIEYASYERLKNIRHTPIKVILVNIETEE